MRIFRKNDLNAFWALFADNLANMVILSGICKYVFKMPDSIVFGRILPGVGVGLIVGLCYYAYAGIQLAKKEGRDNVTALPYGISTPVLFVYLFAVIGPVYWKTGDPLAAWQVGIAAALIGGFIESSGSILGPFLKKYTPRAGMLGTLAGIALVWISAVPMAMLFESPLIGFASLVILFAGLLAGVKMPLNMPAGLFAIMTGTFIGFFTGQASISFDGMGFYLPIPVFGDMLKGLELLFTNSQILAVVIPIEIYNFIETMNNVESAEAAGDKYDVKWCQIMDGVGTSVGALFGNPFPTTVFIGHPAYKRLGAGIGYSFMVGAVFFIGSLFGLVAFLHHLIPEAAVAPMLVFIGLVIVAQAFRCVRPHYAMAVCIAIVPHVSDIIFKKMSGAMSEIASLALKIAPQDNAALIEKLTAYSKTAFDPAAIAALKANQGVNYLGHMSLSQGAIISGLIWGAIVAYLVDSNYLRAFYFALGGAVLTMFGFIHSSQIALNFTPVAAGYAIVAVFFLAAHLFKFQKDDSIEQFDYNEE
ncbi:MAG: xanthine/uracil/vitamin C permease [Candidatus Wallbacteria bacterium GWC2_49_35]|uniref:Xanthine/uracil/vitamin C permease n=1 Tax=Candidatus Wallbacteria bacterium GWC2_49_35 TaxID=1817813 RepID=A0A1F7WV26_9BACT|nr:MAG: xanthine/uracil/vitamin C permease [Candidatus Wallbacteria bacterium GWC2_49_35]HBC76010.1 xanthine/uracil/vitamin C permease [Candidatus Wallbacteria bacterium]